LEWLCRAVDFVDFFSFCFVLYSPQILIERSIDINRFKSADSDDVPVIYYFNL